jgi:REP element-mobilizing transposase RayT
MACRAPTVERFGQPIAHSLPTVIRSFKPAVSKRINERRDIPGVPVWQRNYYEHIIRNDDELNRIREYITSNPAQWETDAENPTMMPQSRT